MPARNDLNWKMDGRAFGFNRGYIKGMDEKIKELFEQAKKQEYLKEV